jgi:hypothetical protein
VVVRQRHVARTEGVEHAQRAQRRPDGLPALHPGERGDAAIGRDPVHVVSGERELEVLGVAAHHLVQPVQLLQGRRDRPVARQVRRHVDRPELRANPAGPQPRKVGVQRRDRPRDVKAVEVVADLLPHLPQQVVVPVDEGGAGQELVQVGEVAHAPPR